MAKLRHVLLLMVGLLLLSLAGSWSLAAGTAARVVVPITQWRLSDGTLRYSVPVRIGGGPPIAAMLDTGSFGLRVMANAVSPRQYEPLQAVRRYRFGSGVLLEGTLAKATLRIGGAATDGPVVVQVVQAIRCTAVQPDCPAARLSPADYRIGGDGLPREGFAAILGVSMRVPDAPSPALNPLDFVGARRWIIVLPRPGDSAPGKLIINPNARDLAGFRTYPVSLEPMEEAGASGAAMRETEMPGCLDEQASDPSGCAPVTMDTGNPNGLQPFFSYRILYDQQHGLIGFRRRN